MLPAPFCYNYYNKRRIVMDINQAKVLRIKLYEQMKACTDKTELEFIWLKINILNAHIRGDLPL